MGIKFSQSISQSVLPRIPYRSRMKVLALAVLLIGSASALGSGPYLPSGWRPRGPAFLLPSEVAEPAVPLKNVPLQTEEASASDSLREYGPPKVVSQDITLQALPDVATERAFAFIEAKFADEADSVTEKVSLNTEEKLSTQVEIETATESEVNEENVVENEAPLQGRSLQITEEQEDQESTTEDNSEVKETEGIVAITEQSVEKKTEQYIKTGVEGVKSITEITETLTSLENETPRAAKNIQGVIGTPQGFLEYGPPGFKEYGPPKEDLLRSQNVVEEKSSADAIQTNETRRRRFSPKFKQTIRRKAH